jgi:polyferredoxin
MPQPNVLNPLVLSKFVLWLVAVVLATVSLVRGKMSSRLRLAFVVGGIIVFGIAYGLLLRPASNPNPVASLRTLLAGLLSPRKIAIPLAVMLVALLGVSWLSNKAICGYGCQLGLLQDLLYRVGVPKWQPRFRVSNGVRVLAFAGLVGGLALSGLDWVGVIDPFRIFQFDLTWPIAMASAGVLGASLFVYRPWCRFLCPFGLTSWTVEQFSRFRPRIDRDRCKGCRVCVRTCPSGAMEDFYNGRGVHADCFACGACVDACPVEDALAWRRS